MDQVDDSDKTLSKSALKKQLKHKRIEEQRQARKEQRKILKREKKERQKSQKDFSVAQRVFHGTRKQDKKRLLAALQDGVRLVIDLSLTHLMTEKEVGSLCRQLALIYAENKRAAKPFHLYFTSFGGSFKEIFSQKNPTHVNWKIDLMEEPYLEVFKKEKEQLLYLTPDSSQNLVDYTTSADNNEALAFDKNLVLIIGGLIDRNRHKNACLHKAQEESIKTAQLPLHLMEGGIKSSQVLTTNQCVEILLKYSETLNWISSVTSAFPQRKRKI